MVDRIVPASEVKPTTLDEAVTRLSTIKVGDTVWTPRGNSLSADTANFSDMCEIVGIRGDHVILVDTEDNEFVVSVNVNEVTFQKVSIPDAYAYATLATKEVEEAVTSSLSQVATHLVRTGGTVNRNIIEGIEKKVREIMNEQLRNFTSDVETYAEGAE